MGTAAIDTEAYPIALRRLAPAEGGGWLAQAPDLPGCMSDGGSPAEAVANLQDAIRAWIVTAQEFGHPVPTPSQPEAVAAE